MYRLYPPVQVAEEEASSSTADTALHHSVGQSSSSEKRGQEQPLAGRAVYQTDAGDADSDDEDGASEQQPVPRAAGPPSAGAGQGDAVFADEHALNEEVDRLMMALQGTSTAMAAPPETSCALGAASLLHLCLALFAGNPCI